jgi:hypothetical protein
MKADQTIVISALAAAAHVAAAPAPSAVQPALISEVENEAIAPGVTRDYIPTVEQSKPTKVIIRYEAPDGAAHALAAYVFILLCLTFLTYTLVL